MLKAKILFNRKLINVKIKKRTITNKLSSYT